MTPRFLVALDLGKHAHVGYIYDTLTQQRSKALHIPVSAQGFADLDAELAQRSSQPSDFLIGHEATGHYGQTVLRRLHAGGYPSVELNATQVAQFRRGLGRHAKTDQLDADTLLRQLATGQFAAPTPASPAQLALQRLTRLREDVVKEQTRWINRLRAAWDQLCPELLAILPQVTTATTLNLLAHYPSKCALATAPLADLTALIEQASRKQKGEDLARRVQATARLSIGVDDRWLEVEARLAVRQLLTSTATLRDLEQDIASLTEAYLTELSVALKLAQPLTVQSFPWGQHIAVGTLLAEIGDARRYPSLKHLLSFLGWCPYTKESGQYRAEHPRLSHKGNRFARRMLWMMAIGAVQSVPEYRDYFLRRVAAGKSKMKTLVAVGRKLLSVIYAILKSGVAYDPKRYLQRQQA